jgi:hypothetical protein
MLRLETELHTILSAERWNNLINQLLKEDSILGSALLSLTINLHFFDGIEASSHIKFGTPRYEIT